MNMRGQSMPKADVVGHSSQRAFKYLSSITSIGKHIFGPFLLLSTWGPNVEICLGSQKMLGVLGSAI